jgi:hypothetical protein
MDDEKTTEGANAEKPSESGDEMEITRLGEDIGEARTSESADSPKAAQDNEPTGSAAPSVARATAKFPFPLKMTQQTWLIAATLLLGLMTLLIFGLTTGKNKASGEARQERGVASLTPESLIAKCGTPADDVTKDLYPMIKRTMSYKSSGKGTLTFEFSRTAEEKSDWVFLSMSDENGATYSTPETQMAAMSCLK